ncbi:MAG: hypothetical protein Q8O94_03475 [bacterium]|nr:hypothetical protein [bacterium]
MNSAMTATAQYHKIFDGIVFPVAVDMMNIKPNITGRTTGANIRQCSQCEFPIVFSLRAFRQWFSLTFLSLTMKSTHRNIFARIGTMNAILSSRRLKVSSFPTVFADNSHFNTSVPVMKTSTAAKTFNTHRTDDKWFPTLLTRFGNLVVSMFLTTRDAAKTLLFVIRFKRFTALQT